MESQPQPQLPPQPQPQLPAQPPAAPTVHTMPEKFLDGQSKKTQPNTRSDGESGGGKFKVIIIVLIIVILVALIAGGVAFYFFYIKMQDSTTTTVSANQNNNTVVANVNANANQNSNKNVNTNSNANLNTNLNTNTNVNANANQNENENLNTNLNQPKQIKESEDSDDDELTDVEEEIYQTKVQKPDSDTDGFTDGQELLAGYNPMGSGMLSDAEDIIGLFQSTQFPYQVLYPLGWAADALDQEQRTMLFTADTGEFVEITVSDNLGSLSAEAWYLDQYPDIEASQLTEATTVSGDLEGVMSLQGYTVYFVDQDYVYTLDYNFGTQTQINFYTTFEMIYRNFQITPAPATDTNVNLNTNSNTNSNANTNTNANLNENTNTNTNIDFSPL